MLGVLPMNPAWLGVEGSETGFLPRSRYQRLRCFLLVMASLMKDMFIMFRILRSVFYGGRFDVVSIH